MKRSRTKVTVKVERTGSFQSALEKFNNRYGVGTEEFFNTRPNSFKLLLSAHPESINLKEIILENPYGDQGPKCYSVIFDNHLVSLIEPGYFVLYNLSSYERNMEAERKLNTCMFECCWLIDNKLVSRSGDTLFVLNDDYMWNVYVSTLPLDRQPKLFEDETYVVFADCCGEFGGRVYFYNKATLKISFTEATCANTVFKKEGKYYVLSHLAHMEIFCSLKELSDPDNFSQRNWDSENLPVRRQPWGHAHQSGVAIHVFDFIFLAAISVFTFNNKLLYLTNCFGRTFLAEIKGRDVSIVHELFNDHFLPFDAVTSEYEKITLIDFGPLGKASNEKKISNIIIQGDTLTRIYWNKRS